MKKLVVLTGAGMSAESGIKTFRDSDGLWEEYDVMQVASIEGWYKNPGLVLQFYNERRKQLKDAEPNTGHTGLVDLEKDFDVSIITQNVDNLHERAGSKSVLHLHGTLTGIKCDGADHISKDIEYNQLNLGDTCDKGHQLRPDIVWFGEAVPAIETAIAIVKEADIFVVIGTSLNVYPAAGLLNYVYKNVPVFIIDPNPVNIHGAIKYNYIKEGAGKGVAILKDKLK